MILTLKQFVAAALAFTLVCATTGRAEAMLAPVDSPGIMSVKRDRDTLKIQTFLEQKQVSQKLGEYGFTPKEIGSRLSTLSDTELHQVATRIEQQNPAGDGAGLVVTLLLIGILALLFVYLLKRV